MNENEHVYIFSKIAWDFGLLPRGLVKSVEAKFGSPKEIEISKKLKIKPTTLYLMQYMPDGCKADCAFCVQGISSEKNRKSSYLVANQLIRFPVKTIIKFVKKSEAAFKRICIQTVFNEASFDDLVKLVVELKKVTDLPISADCVPYSKEQIKRLHNTGLDRITINYELAAPGLFAKIRGEKRRSPYRWELVTEALENALEIFKPPKVFSHLLVGIGETDFEALSHIQNLHDKKIKVSMLSFRPLEGTDLEDTERISHARFHRLQLASYIIKNNISSFKRMQFDKAGNLKKFGIPGDKLVQISLTGKPFITGGCPGCNRPYYTIDPGERHYTYPGLPSAQELQMIVSELGLEKT